MCATRHEIERSPPGSDSNERQSQRTPSSPTAPSEMWPIRGACASLTSLPTGEGAPIRHWQPGGSGIGIGGEEVVVVGASSSVFAPHAATALSATRKHGCVFKMEVQASVPAGRSPGAAVPVSPRSRSVLCLRGARVVRLHQRMTVDFEIFTDFI
jgi:hypothetical protein